MRTLRLFVVLVATLALSIGLTAAPSSAKVERTLDTSIKKVNGRLQFRVDVNPGHKLKTVYVQKKNCKTCKWYKYATKRTNNYGVAKAFVTAPRRGNYFWRWLVPASDGYSKKYSDVWRTYRL